MIFRVLPIPGKRSLAILKNDLNKLTSAGCTSEIADHVAAELFDRLVEIKLIEQSQNCVSFKICQVLKKTISDYLFEDVILWSRESKLPYMKLVQCMPLGMRASYDEMIVSYRIVFLLSGVQAEF